MKDKLIYWLDLAIRDIKTNPDMAIKYINEAKEILSLLKDKMPKKKEGITFHSGRQNSELSAYSPKDNQKVGYNQALDDCMKALEL